MKVVREFSLDEVLSILQEVVNWKDVVLHLGVPVQVKFHIERTYKDAVTQKREAISWWMQNSSTASWKELTNALWKANYPILAERVMHITGRDLFLIVQRGRAY